MYRLCWISKGWDTAKIFRDVPHCYTFDTIEDLKKVMGKCTYDGEWVEDGKGNILDIDLREVCVSPE